MLDVIFHYDASPGLRDKLAGLSDRGLAVWTITPNDPAQFDAALADCEVLWHVLEPLTAAHISAAPKLRLINKVGVGTDTIDLDAARAGKIAVCNTPGANSHAVAEHALGLMLACLRRLVTFDADTRDARGWDWPMDRLDRLGEIGGRTVGLVGMGAVPRRLAPALTALGATIVYTDVAAIPDAPGQYVDLPTLLAAADIVSLHVPLLPETRHMIDASALAKMKPGAILINCARGELVDEAALAAALENGRLAAAGLDTFSAEPAPADHPLFGLANVVVTPHVAWLTPESIDRSLETLIENCRRLDTGEPFLHQVI